MKASCSSTRSKQPHACCGVGMSATSGCSHPVPAGGRVAAIVCSQEKRAQLETQKRYIFNSVMGTFMHAENMGYMRLT